MKKIEAIIRPQNLEPLGKLGIFQPALGKHAFLKETALFAPALTAHLIGYH